MDLLNFLFPKRCLGCGRVGKYFCPSCTPKIRFILQQEAICPVCEKPAIDGITHPRCMGRYALDGLVSLFHYSGIVQKAVKSIKYQYVSDIAEELMQKYPLTSHNFIKTQANPDTIIAPVPLHKIRFRYRGFNQSAVFAHILAKTLNLPIIPNLLIRTKFTAPQVEVIKRENRLKNMEGVFAVNTKTVEGLLNRYPRLSIFLVDDVFTTGATMRAATNVLKRSGIKNVWGVSIAR